MYTEGHWKFLWGGGVLKAKLLEFTKFEAKLEFPGGGGGGVVRGAKQKTLHRGSICVHYIFFWNYTLC